MPISKDFSKRLAQSKAAQKRMKAASKARPSSGVTPEIPNGTYTCRIGVEAGYSKNKNIPFVSFKWVVMEGEYKNKSWNQTYWLEGDDEDRTQREWDNLSRAVQVLAALDDDDMAEFESWDMGDLIGVLEEIDKAAPMCKVRLKNWKGEKSEGITAYFNELIDSSSDAQSDSEEEEDEQDSEEEETDEEEAPRRIVKRLSKAKAKDEEEEEEAEDEEEAEEEVEDKEEEVSISKGDVVWYKPPRTKVAVECKVAGSAIRTQTCDLVSLEDKTKKFAKVPWSSVELAD